MGLMGMLGRGPMSEKKIDKVAKLASNPYAQPDVRKKEMQRLLQEGTAPAHRGVLRRFAANANGQIADEEEKQWLEDAVVKVGEEIGEPLREFIRENKTLSYALRAYDRIFGADEAVRFFLATLDHHGPDAYRQAEAKLQLVLALTEHLDDPRVLAGLRPYLLDHSDDVRWAVLDGLEAALKSGLPEELRSAYASDLAVVLIEDGIGPRVQRRAADLLIAQKWAIQAPDGDLCPLLEEEYFVDKKGYLRQRG